MAVKPTDFSYREVTPELRGVIEHSWKPETGFICTNVPDCGEHPYAEPAGDRRWACLGKRCGFTTINPGIYFDPEKAEVA